MMNAMTETLYRAIEDAHGFLAEIQTRPLSPVFLATAARIHAETIGLIELELVRVDKGIPRRGRPEWSFNVQILKILATRKDLSDPACIERAATEGDAECVALLLEDASIPSKSLDAAFRIAIYYGNNEVARILLADPRVDPTSKNQSLNNYAIWCACIRGNVEAVRMLLGRVDPTTDDNVCLRGVANAPEILESPEIVRLLLADGRADPTSKNNFAIRTASERGHKGIVRLLLADGRADPTVNNYISIRTALTIRYTEIVCLLLADKRIDPTFDNNWCLRTASEKGYTEVVRVLLADERTDPTASKHKSICAASQHGHTEIVRLLLADGRTNPSIGKNTPLYLAVHGNFIEIVRMLLADERLTQVGVNDILTSARAIGHVECADMIERCMQC